jgi:hypothetical protein
MMNLRMLLQVTVLRARVTAAEQASAELTLSNKQLRSNLDKAGRQIAEAQGLQDQLELSLQGISDDKALVTRDAADTDARCAQLQVRVSYHLERTFCRSLGVMLCSSNLPPTRLAMIALETLAGFACVMTRMGRLD